MNDFQAKSQCDTESRNAKMRVKARGHNFIQPKNNCNSLPEKENEAVIISKTEYSYEFSLKLQHKQKFPQICMARGHAESKIILVEST